MASHVVGDAAHVPVMRDAVLELLAPALTVDDAVCVDATLGAGGHAEALLTAHPSATVIGLDRDRSALESAGRRLAEYGPRFHAVHAIYSDLGEVLAELDIERIDGALFDLGVSSMQLDEAGRGFAYAQDAPLDMRMDQSGGITAEHVVNTYDRHELTRILREYGEERFAGRIAASIVRRRDREPITSSRVLADLVRDAIPAATRRHGGHPAKRTFQALRIEVNGELAALSAALPTAIDALRPGGRIVVLSYHSLEDRIVKRALTARARSSAPEGLPTDVPGTEPTLRLLTKGARTPGDTEVAANPRAASVKCRAAQRIAATPPPDTAQGEVRQ